MRMVVFGVSPSPVSPVYESDPAMPAPPVPEDQVEITFLEERMHDTAWREMDTLVTGAH